MAAEAVVISDVNNKLKMNLRARSPQIRQEHLQSNLPKDIVDTTVNTKIEISQHLKQLNRTNNPQPILLIQRLDHLIKKKRFPRRHQQPKNNNNDTPNDTPTEEAVSVTNGEAQAPENQSSPQKKRRRPFNKRKRNQRNQQNQQPSADGVVVDAPQQSEQTPNEQAPSDTQERPPRGRRNRQPKPESETSDPQNEQSPNHQRVPNRFNRRPQMIWVVKPPAVVTEAPQSEAIVVEPHSDTPFETAPAGSASPPAPTSVPTEQAAV